jgi:hypothetical protein
MQPAATGGDRGGPAGARRGGAAGARVRVRTPERRPVTSTQLHRTRSRVDRPPGASPASAHRPLRSTDRSRDARETAPAERNM